MEYDELKELKFRDETIKKFKISNLDKDSINNFRQNIILFFEYSNEDDGEIYLIDNNSNLYQCDSIYNKEHADKLIRCFPELKCALEFKNSKFKSIDLGLGHTLFIQCDIYKDFKKILNKNINHNEYYKKHSIFCHWMDCAIKLLKQKNINEKLTKGFGKKLKVTLKTGQVFTGIFSEIFEEDNEILIGLIAIKENEIEDIDIIESNKKSLDEKTKKDLSIKCNKNENEKIASYYSPIERYIMLVLSRNDIEFLRKMGINTLNNKTSNIIEELKKYIKTHKLDENANMHCKNILGKIKKLDLKNKNLYIYISVIYDDDIAAKTIGEPSFYYKTDVKEISIGDRVLVNRNNKEVIGIVIDIQIYHESDVPYPLDKTKDIIKILNNHGDKIEVYQSSENKYIEMRFLGKYQYIGGEDSIDLTIGNIYNRVGSENEFRIVDNSGEDYLYSPQSFVKIQ